MLGIGLPSEEIAKRLTRLHNLERLYEDQKLTIRKIREENQALKQEVAVLYTTIQDQAKTIENLKLAAEELRTIVFGKKRKDTEHHDDLPPTQAAYNTPRTNASYRRTIPGENEITERTHHPIDICSHCHGPFSKREEKTYYEEDIPLPQKKIVIKHTIEKGYCSTCKQWDAPSSPPTASVILGRNVRRYVVYLSVVCRESYSQIEDILKQSYDFDISQGEIAKILEKEGERLRPYYERLKVNIRGEPSVHLDETGWNILIHQGERGFAWTMVGGVSKDAVFMLGKNRGKGNAEDLIGDSRAVRITDDYSAYRNLRGDHQLCCAHILRKLRDLASSEEITEKIRVHCTGAYTSFASIYADIERARISSEPVSYYNVLRKRLMKFAAMHPYDPAKLVRVKTQIRKRSLNYLTCLLHPHVASDNNAAERSLRHLVLKRKISFGSLCERTAETTAILLSVLMSWRQRGTLREYLAGV